MCVYCSMGDWQFRHDPPWRAPDYPPLPQSVPAPLPTLPVMPTWTLDKLREYYELLKAVKEMEDKLGCPCEPNKADYLKLLRDRIDHLEKRLNGSA